MADLTITRYDNEFLVEADSKLGQEWIDYHLGSAEPACLEINAANPSDALALEELVEWAVEDGLDLKMQ
jgi:hypothetical protein